MRTFARLAYVLLPCSFLFTACQTESDLDEYEAEEEIATTEDALEGGACDLADAPWLFCWGLTVLENGEIAGCAQAVLCPCDTYAYSFAPVRCEDGQLVDASPPPPEGYPLPGWPEVCSGAPLDCYR